MFERPSIRSLVIALAILIISTASLAQIGISITVGPPPLPVYEQPPCPSEGYIWTPGYWAYDYNGGGYYWVPGTWVEPPQVGLLWTPGYWGWGADRYVFHEGYWGPHVGFYGGISYGYGYFGEGYQGGRWDNGRFFYNRSVNNVNVVNIHNVYNTTVINNVTANRVSYNGGHGGIDARPRSEDEIAQRDRHIGPIAAQNEHMQAARNDRQLRASVNQGRPPVAATPRPGAFKDRDAVGAREAGGAYNAGPNHGNYVPRPNNEARDLQPHARPGAPNTGNPKLDQKYQQQQQKLYNKQDQDHQKLQQKQDRDHQQMAQRNANEARTQQVEQKHQQQTQQLEQKHQQQTQRLETHQQPQAHSQPNGGREHH
jgi:hypothetical protein